MTAPGPLAGRRVVVTRAAEQAGPLVEQVRALGAEVIEVPVIAIAEPADGGAALGAAVAGLDRYEWVVVTSPNGAERLAAAVPAARRPGVRLAVVGPGTAEAARRNGLEPALVPERAIAEGLLAEFPPPSGTRRVLLAQAAAARPVLAEGLAAAGWVVDAVEAYRTVAARPTAAALAAAAGSDAITFTSTSAVESYVAVAGRAAVPPVVVCIGPVTAAAAERLGLSVAAVAAEHTLRGLVVALLGALTGTLPSSAPKRR